MAAPSLSVHPLPSLNSNCSNMPFGTQGRSWRLETSLQTRNGGTQKGFHAQDPHRVLLIFSISKVFGKSHSWFEIFILLNFLPGESQHHSRYGKKKDTPRGSLLLILIYIVLIFINYVIITHYTYTKRKYL